MCEAPEKASTSSAELFPAGAAFRSLIVGGPVDGLSMVGPIVPTPYDIFQVADSAGIFSAPHPSQGRRKCRSWLFGLTVNEAELAS